jgi:thioredoxin-related protein
MKKQTIIAAGIALLILFAVGFSKAEKTTETGSGIKFHTGTWSEALTLAKNENKPVFVDISTSWCGYCKRMKANVFTDENIGKYYNENFINVSVDAEKGEGILLAEKYGVRSYPTFVFLNPDGSLLEQTAGYRNEVKFLELAKEISKNAKN